MKSDFDKKSHKKSNNTSFEQTQESSENKDTQTMFDNINRWKAFCHKQIAEQNINYTV